MTDQGDPAAALEAARRALRERDELIDFIAHELRTPLTPLLGWVRLLKGGQLSDEKRRLALDAIERAALQEAHLIEQLLELGRLLNGRLTVTPGELDVVRVATAAVESVRASAEAAGVSLRLMRPDVAVYAQGDEMRLGQVLSGLLLHAVNASESGQEVGVAVRAEARRVLVDVTDHGEPMDDAWWSAALDGKRVPRGRSREIGLDMMLAARLARVLNAELSCRRVTGLTALSLALPTVPKLQR